MRIWKRVRNALPSLPWGRESTSESQATHPEIGDVHLEQARDSLRALVEDPKVPETVRSSLGKEFQQVQTMLDKLEYGHIHIAVFGRVGVGKSALLNALLGEARFSTSPLHGETRDAEMAAWKKLDAGGVFLIDTPGINEVDGDERERLAHDVAGRSDLVLFVVEGDISETELSALRLLLKESRMLLLVVNKMDRYTQANQALILDALLERTHGLLPLDHIVQTAADPAERIYIQVDDAGQETEVVRQPPPAVQDLRERLWSILDQEGKTLAALNATLFAGKLSDVLSKRVLEVKKDLANKLVHSYCLAKGVAVGFNPVPVADLAAAIIVDVSLIVHLSRIYGLPVSRHEAGELVRTIVAQMALLMGTVWTVHLVSSVLKGGSLGVSTLLTAATQGAVAYYATYVVGQAAHRYFEHGKSWGEKGAKRTVQEILESVDRKSLLAEGRDEIVARLRAG